MNLENGSVINQYKIISLIGKGGMGEVFLAEDTKLDRKVALKILPPEFAEDADRMSRFVREAKSASALNHPNIITIYEIGESDGTHFIATEFIDGKTLNDYKKANPIDYKSALEIAIQVASALDEAHHAGIVHRDIKPDNVMIRSNGLAKILDFGIAKLSEPPAVADGLSLGEDDATAIQKPSTSPGLIIGTANYMSPEQAKGKAVDTRTDIFSFGVLLYEMMAGHLPFEGETALEMIGAILHKKAKPLDADVPPEISKIIGKCLRKDRDERYQTIKEVGDDLKQLQVKLLIEAEIERASAPNLKEANTQILQPATTAENEAQNSIAVLPFTNISADEDNEYFCDGLAEELLNALAKIEDLRVAARTSAFSFKGKNANVGEIGEKLHVKNVLEGSVRRSGDKLRISVQLVNASDGYHLWSERYDRELRDIFDVQDEIALAVVDALKMKLLGEEKADLLKRYTDDTEAYELYLKGRYHYNKYSPEGWQKGIEYFQKATEKAPQLAPAFAGIAQCQFMLWFFGAFRADEIIPKARAAASRALAIDERLAESHSSLAHIHCYHDWLWEEAERGYRRAVELSPNSADAHAWYGMLLVSRRRFEEAIAAGRRALELDPLSLFLNVHVGWLFFFADRLDDVLEQDRKIFEIEPGFYGAHWQKGAVHSAREEFDEAIESLRRAIDLGGHQIALSHLGCAYALAGNRKQASEVLNQLLDVRKSGYAAAFNVARVYAAMGENDKTFEWLEKAIEERNGEMILLDRQVRAGAGIWGEKFPADPRYQDVLRRIGLPADEIEPNKPQSVSEAQRAILSRVTTNEQENSPSIAKTDEQSINPKSRIPNPKSKWRLFGLLGLILLTSIVFAYRYFTINSKQIESIAVMPFVNESGNADVEYLSDGMTETLIGSLSQIPNLSVKARSSVFRYKGKETNPNTIGKELNVQAILNGRVVQRGERLTLSLELIDAQTENVIWSERYDRRQTDLMNLQKEIARDVSQKLKTKLSGADAQKLSKNYTENPEAYQLYLRGRFYWNKRTVKETQKAIEYFEQAIAVDPNYALGYAGLADSYALAANLGGAMPHGVMPKAREAALKALSLDDELAEAHSTLGLILTNYDLDFAGAEREYKRALELNPNYATAHHYYGQLLSQLGRHEEALAFFRKALELEPLSLVINTFYARVLLYARRYDEAILQSKKTLELDPNFPLAHITLSGIYQAKGNYAEAVEEFAKFNDLTGESQIAAEARESFARGGWQAFLRKMSEANRLSRYTPFQIIFLVALGEKDKAIDKLYKGYEERTFFMTQLKVLPHLDPLRDEPRFRELLRQIGFQE